MSMAMPQVCSEIEWLGVALDEARHVAAVVGGAACPSSPRSTTSCRAPRSCGSISRWQVTRPMIGTVAVRMLLAHPGGVGLDRAVGEVAVGEGAERLGGLAAGEEGDRVRGRRRQQVDAGRPSPVIARTWRASTTGSTPLPAVSSMPVAAGRPSSRPVASSTTRSVPGTPVVASAPSRSGAVGAGRRADLRRPAERRARGSSRRRGAPRPRRGRRPARRRWPRRCPRRRRRGRWWGRRATARDRAAGQPDGAGAEDGDAAAGLSARSRVQRAGGEGAGGP